MVTVYISRGQCRLSSMSFSHLWQVVTNVYIKSAPNKISYVKSAIILFQHSSHTHTHTHTHTLTHTHTHTRMHKHTHSQIMLAHSHNDTYKKKVNYVKSAILPLKHNTHTHTHTHICTHTHTHTNTHTHTQCFGGDKANKEN